MKPQISATLSRATCLYVSKSGRHCRFPVLASAQFCRGHIHLQFGSPVQPLIDINLDADLTSSFTPQALNFKSGSEVNEFLCSLVQLIVENRISARRGSVLAYIASLQLRTLPVMDLEFERSQFQDECPRIVFDPPIGYQPQQSPSNENLSPSVTTGLSPS
jgi:hypothetical protein